MEKETQHTTRSKGGRNKVDPTKARCHRIQLYLTLEEHQQLLHDYEQSGYRSLSGYVAKKLSNKKQATINPVLFLEQMDNIGKDINRIGNHITQIAQYANTLFSEDNTDTNILIRFHEQMRSYHKLRLKLVAAYRAIIKTY